MNVKRAGGWWENKRPLEAVDETDLLHLEPVPDEMPPVGIVARALVCACMPAKRGRGAGRNRYRAAFLRFVALVWVADRDAIEAQSLPALAELLGADRTTMETHVAFWRARLRACSAPNNALPHDRPSLAASHGAPSLAAGPPQRVAKQGSARPFVSIVRTDL